MSWNGPWDGDPGGRGPYKGTEYTKFVDHRRKTRRYRWDHGPSWCDEVQSPNVILQLEFEYGEGPVTFVAVRGLSGIVLRPELPGTEVHTGSWHDRCRRYPKTGWGRGTEGVPKESVSVRRFWPHSLIEEVYISTTVYLCPYLLWTPLYCIVFSVLFPGDQLGFFDLYVFDGLFLSFVDKIPSSRLNFFYTSLLSYFTPFIIHWSYSLYYVSNFIFSLVFLWDLHFNVAYFIFDIVFRSYRLY